MEKINLKSMIPRFFNLKITSRSKPFKTITAVCLILVIGFIVFAPCLKNGFVNWDDDKYVINNSSIKVLSAENIKKIFTSFFVGNYQPATILSYLFDYQIFRLDPLGYHLTNLILHLINCLLVFWLMLMLTRKYSTSLIVAILFTAHPLHVESVAWISERKDVLYAAFFLGAVICYYKYLQGRTRSKYYLLAIILFLLSLLAKSMAMTLPLILFLIDYISGRKRDKYLLADKIPFLILSFIFGIIAVYSQHPPDRVITQGLGIFWDKFVIACYCIIFYLKKIFLPVRLSCLYPYYDLENISRLFFYPAACAAIIIAAAISRKYTKKLIFGCLFFLIAILPVLQFMSFGEALVADRYTYIPSIGIFYVLAEGIIWLYGRKIKYCLVLRGLLSLALIGVIGALLVFTWNRCKVWRDGISLWSNVLDNHPNTTTAYNNRGVALFLQGRYVEAQADFDHTIGIDSNYYRRSRQMGNVFYNQNLSSLYNSKGLNEQAIILLEKAIANDRQHAYSYYNNLAVSYANIGKVGQAILLLDELIAADQGKNRAYFNLGLIYKNLKEIDKAAAMFNKAIEADPAFADAYHNLGMICQDRGEILKALSYYKKAERLDPGNPNLYNNLAVAYNSIGKYRETIAYCKKALTIDPYSAQACTNLGNAYCSIGKNKEAIICLRKALDLSPELAVAHNNLAAAYYFAKEYDLAIMHCDKAVELGYKVAPEFLEWLKPHRK